MEKNKNTWKNNIESSLFYKRNLTNEQTKLTQEKKKEEEEENVHTQSSLFFNCF